MFKIQLQWAKITHLFTCHADCTGNKSSDKLLPQKNRMRFISLNVVLEWGRGGQDESPFTPRWQVAGLLTSMDVERTQVILCLAPNTWHKQVNKKWVNLILISSVVGLWSQSYLVKPLPTDSTSLCMFFGPKAWINHSDLYLPDFGQQKIGPLRVRIETGKWKSVPIFSTSEKIYIHVST